MDHSSAKWLFELEMDEPTLIPHYPITITDESSIDVLNFNTFSTSSSSYSNVISSFDQSWTPKTTLPNSNNLNISSLASQVDVLNETLGFYGEMNCTKTTRSSIDAQTHVLSERKRRERLTQRFVALSALLPDLKKMDKMSVLGDGIKYIKQLQEQVKTLEEEKKRQHLDLAVAVKRSQITGNNVRSSSSGDNQRLLFPDIQVKISDMDVLVRIQSRKQKGLMMNILGEMEKLHLTIITSNILPFGNTYDMTIIAQGSHPRRILALAQGSVSTCSLVKG